MTTSPERLKWEEDRASAEYALWVEERRARLANTWETVRGSFGARINVVEALDPRDPPGTLRYRVIR